MNPLGGPRTPEGKKKSSLNALKHGLYAKSSHALDDITNAHGVDFRNVLDQMNRHYRPADPVEKQLVLRIARCVWRLSLSASMEERLLERGGNGLRPGSSYEKILKYERLVDIHLHRALVMLQRKRESEPNRQPTTGDCQPCDKNNSRNEPPLSTR